MNNVIARSQRQHSLVEQAASLESLYPAAHDDRRVSAMKATCRPLTQHVLVLLEVVGAAVVAVLVRVQPAPDAQGTCQHQ